VFEVSEFGHCGPRADVSLSLAELPAMQPQDFSWWPFGLWNAATDGCVGRGVSI
jgi:hypothetical protein